MPDDRPLTILTASGQDETEPLASKDERMYRCLLAKGFLDRAAAAATVGATTLVRL